VARLVDIERAVRDKPLQLFVRDPAQARQGCQAVNEIGNGHGAKIVLHAPTGETVTVN
jgi:hypothetical protein